MKTKHIVYLILTIFAISSCKNQNNVLVISIGYHSDNCEDCNILKSKMRSMNRNFAFSPIVFIKYDKTDEKTKFAAEEKLRKWHMLEIAQRDDGLKYVILYDAQSKEKLEIIDFDDDINLIKSKIKKALEEVKRTL